jgi:hypothetical protein
MARRPEPRKIINGLTELLVRGKSPKGSVLEPNSFHQWHDNIIIHKIIDPSEKKEYFIKLLPPQDQDT